MSHEKVIVISIRPEHALNILNGKKTLELRKSVPKGFVGWVYVYVTKGVGKSKYHHLYNLTEYNNGKTLFSITQHNKYSLVPDGFLNGKVVFRFWFDEYKTLEYHKKNEVLMWDNNYYYYTEEENTYCSVQWILDELCLEHQQVLDYGKEKDLYAWHIKKLEVFDTSMELSEFKNVDISKYQDSEGNPSFDDYFEVKRAPQSWQYAYILGAKQ